ncbi:MAG: AraC family transcriptional regulator [Acholeplasma sp.]|nr:AraC family transcriptional regulator [Acholeplasma sp.]
MERYEQYKKILIYIEKNLNGTFCFSEMEKNLNYSIRHIRRQFSYYNSLSMNRYILERKIAYIVYSVTFLDESLQVAYCKYGFQSYDVFSRVFKKYYGKTPARNLKTYKVLIRKIIGDLTVPVLALDDHQSISSKSMISFRDIYWQTDCRWITSFLINVNHQADDLMRTLIKIESGLDYLHTLIISNDNPTEQWLKQTYFSVINKTGIEHGDHHIFFIKPDRHYPKTVNAFYQYVYEKNDIAFMLDDRLLIDSDAYYRFLFAFVQYINSGRSLGASYESIRDFLHNGYNLIQFKEGSAYEMPHMVLDMFKYIYEQSAFEHKNHLLIIQSKQVESVDALTSALKVFKKNNPTYKVEFGFLIEEKMDVDLKLTMIQTNL